MNSNPRARRIVNEYARPGADRFCGLINDARHLLAQASAQGTADVFRAGSTDRVDDGSDVDGRAPVTDADVRALLAATQALVTWADTPLPSVGASPLAVFLRLAVNPR